MITEFRNPFSITYASQLSDQLISDYWVKFPGGDDFLHRLNPNESGPKLILGGRGSGKTHLMRYMSFDVRKLGYPDNLLLGIKKDGYIGLYFRCSALNSTKFEGKGQSAEMWDQLFAYYMELWFAELLLTSVSEAFRSNVQFAEIESRICIEGLQLFDDSPGNATNIYEFISLLKHLRGNVDKAVNNIAFSKGAFDELKITVSPTALLSGLPKLIAKYFPDANNIAFLYLIDEFENLSESQQRYINTLVKECSLPLMIYIGARLYGIKTYETLGGRDANKPHSDFEPIYLDSFLRKKSKDYKTFATKLCEKRLSRAGFGNHSLIEAFKTEDMEYRIMQQRSKVKDLPTYFKRLRRQLSESNVNGLRQKPEKIEEIIQNLSCPNDAILEKANIILLYRAWSKHQNLFKATEKISIDCQKYINGHQHGTMQRIVLEKFKNDIIAQLLARDFKANIDYLGINTFIEMSEGLPRNLLQILKQIFDWGVFYGEKPFQTEAPISIKAQTNGVRDASNWFLREVGILGEYGPSIVKAITRLGNFLREMRFSDKPSECSAISFSFDKSSISKEAAILIELAEKFSLIVRISPGQKNRNSRRVDEKFQLSKMLVPYWDLPTASRGTPALTGEAVDSIFSTSDDEIFERIMRERLRGVNAPFRPKNGSNAETLDTQSLF